MPTIFPGNLGSYSAETKTLTLYSAFDGEIWLDSVDRLDGDTTYMFETDAETIDGTRTTRPVLLAGNGNSNHILAGSGGSSLWGGTGGDDVLQCGSGRDMVWFGSGCGKDTATSFAPGTGGSSDVLNFYAGGIAGIERTGTSIKITMDDGAELAAEAGNLVDTATSIQYSANGRDICQARIGESAAANNIVCDDAVSAYVGGNETDILTVNGNGNHEIWLDGSHGVFYMGIEQVNSFAATGSNAIIGAGASESLVGGQGATTLWGGSGGDDTLHGGSGTDTFWYGKGEGTDVIVNSNSADHVVLRGLSLGSIDLANLTASRTGGIYIPFSEGGSLTVSFGEDITSRFTLANDNTTWRYNFSTSQWTSSN